MYDKENLAMVCSLFEKKNSRFLYIHNTISRIVRFECEMANKRHTIWKLEFFLKKLFWKKVISTTYKFIIVPVIFHPLHGLTEFNRYSLRFVDFSIFCCFKTIAWMWSKLNFQIRWNLFKSLWKPDEHFIAADFKNEILASVCL